MTVDGRGRKLLTSSTRVATLVCVGVAETACNLQLPPDGRTTIEPIPTTDGEGGRGQLGARPSQLLLTPTKLPLPAAERGVQVR